MVVTIGVVLKNPRLSESVDEKARSAVWLVATGSRIRLRDEGAGECGCEGTVNEVDSRLGAIEGGRATSQSSSTFRSPLSSLSELNERRETVNAMVR